MAATEIVNVTVGPTLLLGAGLALPLSVRRMTTAAEPFRFGAVTKVRVPVPSMAGACENNVGLDTEIRLNDITCPGTVGAKFPSSSSAVNGPCERLATKPLTDVGVTPVNVVSSSRTLILVVFKESNGASLMSFATIVIVRVRDALGVPLSVNVIKTFRLPLNKLFTSGASWNSKSPAAEMRGCVKKYCGVAATTVVVRV